MGAPASVAARPLSVWTEIWTAPRPVRFYFVRLDLDSPDYEVHTLVADDPDGDGPAEAALTDPLTLAASRPGIVAAVNANAFRPVPDAEGKLDTTWHAGQPVDIVGLAAAGGVVRSQGEPGRDAFWTARDRRVALGNTPTGGRVQLADPRKDRPSQLRDPGKARRSQLTAHIGHSTEAASPVEGVGDWNARLVADGAIVAPATEAVHPRTLLGMDATRRWLLLVVADGRQPGYSEGLSLREAADVLASHGCAEGLNLDGGGSSVLLVTDDTASATLRTTPATRAASATRTTSAAATSSPAGAAALHIANHPSGGSPRPVPVMLGIARR